MHIFWKIAAIKFMCVTAITWSMYNKYQSTPALYSMAASSTMSADGYTRVLFAAQYLFVCVVVLAWAGFAMDVYMDWYAIWTPRTRRRARWQILSMLLAALLAAAFTAL